MELGKSHPRSGTVLKCGFRRQRRNNFPAGGSPTSEMAQADGIFSGRYSATSRITRMSHRMRALLRAVQFSLDGASDEFDEMLDHYLSRTTLSLFLSCLIFMKDRCDNFVGSARLPFATEAQ